MQTEAVEVMTGPAVQVYRAAVFCFFSFFLFFRHSRVKLVHFANERPAGVLPVHPRGHPDACRVQIPV